MIKRRRAKEDDYIGPLKGWPKFFHRLFLLITFPLRKPLWTLLILLLMFLVPTFRGVKPAEVHLWYWQKIKHSSDTISATVADKAKDLSANLPQMLPTEEPVAAAPVKVVEMPAKKSSRTVFERAKSAPVVVPEAVEATAAPAAEEAVNTPTNPAPRKELRLKYLNQPQTISGLAVVISANVLMIGKSEMFLYGIYADPASANGRAAAEYLHDATAGQIVSCQVNAYTYQGVATAICHVGDTNLNRELVNRGFSKNVALD